MNNAMNVCIINIIIIVVHHCCLMGFVIMSYFYINNINIIYINNKYLYK